MSVHVDKDKIGWHVGFLVRGQGVSRDTECLLDSYPCYLLAGHTRHDIGLRDLKRVGRPYTRKQIQQTCYDPCPSGLMASSKPAPLSPWKYS